MPQYFSKVQRSGLIRQYKYLIMLFSHNSLGTYYYAGIIQGLISHGGKKGVNHRDIAS